MISTTNRPTRGGGLLESLLASLRARRAEKCIPDGLRDGRILDVGCGAAMQFLRDCDFKHKQGIDQLSAASAYPEIPFTQVDLNVNPRLPFESNLFSVVTMLAVVEHLSSAVVPEVFKEIHRVLVPGGMFVITVPAPWSDPLLRVMACLRLVSSIEIDEHQNALNRRQLVRVLEEAGFRPDNVESGYFEFGLNTWISSVK